MKLGFFTMPVHRLDRDYTETLEEDREAVILADRLGYSEAYVGEHLTDAAENITNSMLFQASLISETRNIKLGTGTTNLSHAHPVVIAAQGPRCSTTFSRGGSSSGSAPVALESDAEALGIRGLDRRRDVRRVHRPHRRHLAGRGPPTTSKASTGRSRRGRPSSRRSGSARIVKPYQKPHPPVLGTVVAPHSSTATEMGAPRIPPHLRELPHGELGPDPLGQLRQGLRGGGADPGPGRLAGRPFGLRQRRPPDRPRLRAGERAEPLPLLLPAALHQAQEARPARRVQADPPTSPTRS